MTSTRRKFLRTGALTAISAGFGIASVRLAFSQNRSPVVRRSTDVPLDAQRESVFMFKPETFRPYVGGYFQAPNARGQMIALKLVSLTPFKPTRTGLNLTGKVGQTESFSLLFKADSRLPLFVPIHKMNHPALGEFDLFLTERKGETGDFYYEAVINHIP